MDLQLVLAALIADIGTLRAAYQRAGLLSQGPANPVTNPTSASNDSHGFRRNFLMVDAVIRCRLPWLLRTASAMRHVVVFGGNNVGKSTVVNILAACDAASCSPQGGHTRHSQAFVSTKSALFANDSHCFSAFREVSSASLPDSPFESFSRSMLTESVLPSDIVVWDTPDCDAVGSERYLAGVVEALASADLVIYVTSSERYAVEHLVEWVFLLADAGLPLLECINKTRQRDRQTVIDTQRTRIFPIVAERLKLSAPDPEIVALRYLTDGDDCDLWAAGHSEATQLRERTFEVLRATSREQAARKAVDFAVRGLDQLLAPLRTEIAARAIWTDTVTCAVAAFTTSYDEKYLKSDTMKEPFKQLNMQLVKLLEPQTPGLSMAISLFAQNARLPVKFARQAAAKGLEFVRQKLSSGNGSEKASSPETKVFVANQVALFAAIDRRLNEEIAAERHHAFWDRIGEAWRKNSDAITESVAKKFDEHVSRVDIEIGFAALDILNVLKNNPTQLATLRRLRVAIDVGGLAIGFICVGHHAPIMDIIEELIIAPLLLSGIEGATNQAAGQYVAHRRDAILDRIRESSRRMVEEIYFTPLIALRETALGEASLVHETALLDRIPAGLKQFQLAAASS